MALIAMPPSRQEWLALRSAYVGASEVAALFGCEPDYALSHYALWHVKAGNAPAPDVGGPRVEWGLRLEAVIAEGAALENGWAISKGRYATDDECRLGASLDFEIASDPDEEGPGVLETKAVDFLIHRRNWTDGEPPLHILLQLQAQLGASGFKWGAVAALVGGNDLRTYRYKARPDLIRQIKQRVAGFWLSIARNSPPPVDGSDGAAHVIRALYPEPVDEAVDMSARNEWPEAVWAFLAAQTAKKEAEENYALARNRVMALMGDAKRGYGGGYSVTMSVTPEKAPRAPRPGEMIPGRAETRRLIAKETVEPVA